MKDSANLLVDNSQSCLLWQADACLSFSAFHQVGYFLDLSDWFKWLIHVSTYAPLTQQGISGPQQLV
jgi:hypothetical protein